MSRKSNKDIIRDFLSEAVDRLDDLIENDDYNDIQSENNALKSENENLSYEIEELEKRIENLEYENQELKEQLKNNNIKLW